VSVESVGSDTDGDEDTEPEVGTGTTDTTPKIDTARAGGGPNLLSRVFVTWVELTVAGFAGAAVGGAASGPPQLVVYLATTLVSVGILLYNVDRLVRAHLDAGI
jgi:hypothetical protein